MADKKKKYNEILDEDGKVLYEVSNVRVIRMAAGLKQVELANLSGLTQAYFSEVESGKKELTKGAAIKIAEALNKLINEPGKSDVNINAIVLWAGHTASNYPEELQKRIIDLFLVINKSNDELYHILKHRDYPADPDSIRQQPGESTRIVSLVMSRLNVIQENKEEIISSNDFDESGGPLMSFMPKF